MNCISTRSISENVCIITFSINLSYSEKFPKEMPNYFSLGRKGIMTE